MIYFNAAADADPQDKSAFSVDGTTTTRQFKGQGSQGSGVFSVWRTDGVAVTGTVTLQRQLDSGDANSWVDIASLPSMGAQTASGTFPNGTYRAVTSGLLGNAVKITLEGV